MYTVFFSFCKTLKLIFSAILNKNGLVVYHFKENFIGNCLKFNLCQDLFSIKNEIQYSRTRFFGEKVL